MVLRLGVVAGASVAGRDEGSSDFVYHSQLVADPVGHLRGSEVDVEQYAPYLGFAEWMTAKPWLVLGADDATALRLGSVTWDLLGMAVLLLVVARKIPGALVTVGLIWGVSLLMWPASAFAGQDEPIAAAIVAVAVALAMVGRRPAAIAVLVVGLFVAKILLLPVLVAFLLTAPKSSRKRELGVAAITLLTAVVVTWSFSGTDGLSQQLGYTTDVLGFSITLWSMLVLHHFVTPETAVRASEVVASVTAIVIVIAWSRHREDGESGAYRLAAALLFASFAVLAVSNPEYLCIAAPVAIIASVTIAARVPWLLLAATTMAWVVRVVYYALRNAYDPTGSILARKGFADDLSGRVRLLDTVHQSVLVITLLLLLAAAWRWAVKSRPRFDEDLSGGAFATGSRQPAPVELRRMVRVDSGAGQLGPQPGDELEASATAPPLNEELERATGRRRPVVRSWIALVESVGFLVIGVAVALDAGLQYALVCWAAALALLIASFAIHRDF